MPEKKQIKKVVKETKKTTLKKKDVKTDTVIKQNNKQIVNIKINTNDIKQKTPEKKKPTKKPVDNKPINENWSLEQKKRFSSKNRPNNAPEINSNASILLNEIMARNGKNSLHEKQSLEAKDKYKSRLTETTNDLNNTEDKINSSYEAKLLYDLPPITPIKKTPKPTAPEMIDFGTKLGKIEKLGISPMKPPLFANPVNYPISNISFDDLYEKRAVQAGIVKNTHHCSVCKKNNDFSDRAYGHYKPTCPYYKEGGKFQG